MKKTFDLSFIPLFKLTISMALTLSTAIPSFAQTPDIGERNKEVIRKYQERINAGDSNAAAAYISDTMKNFGRIVGPNGIRHVLNDVLTTFPDWRAETLEIVAIGDAVILRQKVTGTHLGIGKIFVNGGLLLGVQPTNKRFEVTHMHWYTLREGKIIGHYGNRDDLSMMQQLGLIPMSLAQTGNPAAPGRFHQMLARSNGTWTGEGTMQFSSDAKPVDAGKSILYNKMAVDGLYQISEVRGIPAPGMGAPWTGLRITGYDSARKVFTRAMIGDGTSAGVVAMEGLWDEASKSITMPFLKIDPSTGKQQELKEVYKIVDENTEILEIYSTDPKTKKEFKMLNIKWTRKK